MNPEAHYQSKEENPNDGSDQVAVRQGKLDQMRENGFDPFRQNWDQTHTSLEACSLLPENQDEGPTQRKDQHKKTNVSYRAPVCTCNRLYWCNYVGGHTRAS